MNLPMSEPEELASAPQAAPPRTSWRLLLVGIVAAAAAVILMRQLRIESSQGVHHPAVGRELPPLKLAACVAAQDGLKPDDIRGQVVLINFWGTWCPPCREELPHLMRLYAAWQKEPQFRFISVSCSHSGDDTPATVGPETQAFLAAEHYDLPVYCDPEAAFRIPVSLGLRFDGFQYPTTLIADAQGKVRGVWIGFSRGDDHEMERLIRELLAERSASDPS